MLVNRPMLEELSPTPDTRLITILSDTLCMDIENSGIVGKILRDVLDIVNRLHLIELRVLIMIEKLHLGILIDWKIELLSHNRDKDILTFVVQTGLDKIGELIIEDLDTIVETTNVNKDVNGEFLIEVRVTRKEGLPIVDSGSLLMDSYVIPVISEFIVVEILHIGIVVAIVVDVKLGIELEGVEKILNVDHLILVHVESTCVWVVGNEVRRGDRSGRL